MYGLGLPPLFHSQVALPLDSRVQSTGLRDQGIKLKVYGLGLPPIFHSLVALPLERIPGLRIRFQGPELRVQGIKLGVNGPGCNVTSPLS